MRDILFAIALISLGAASGYGIKRALAHSPAPSAAAPVSQKHSSSSAPASASSPSWEITENHSAAEIAALPPGAMRTAETVLWLPKATAEELRDFWRQMLAKGSNDDRLKNLVLDRWMRVAPDDALKETAGSEDEYMPWVAWGRIDPELGVREAKARKSGYLWRVLQGAGSAQPELAKKLLAENPGYDYPAVTYAIGEGLQNDSWQAALEYQFDGSQLATWARYEPVRAFEWALENSSRMLNHSSPWKQLVEQMLDQEPAKLEAAIAALPAGKLKGDLTFEKASALAARDPAAVLAMADAAEPGGPRNRLLAIAGPALVESNPAKALELLREFAPGGFSVVPVEYPKGSSRSGFSPGYAAIGSWIIPLLKQDPATVIGILPSDAKEQVLPKWMTADRDGFGNWVSSLPNASERDRQFSELVRSYGFDSDPSSDSFAEAMTWTEQISQEAARSNSIQSLMNEWLSRRRELAMRYFGPDGPAGDQEKAEFQKLLERKGGQR